MPYVKLDAGILDSTLWLEDSDTCKVFITLLAMTRSDGLVEATAPVIARRANINIDRARHALKVLESPDPDSRSLADDGRRIRRVDGGYEIVNYLKYREKDHTNAERQRRHREREKARKDNGVTGVTGRNVTGGVTQAEAEAESLPPDGGKGATASPPPCPQREIVSLWNEVMPDQLPRVLTWRGDRERNLRSRWREYPQVRSLDWWRDFFAWLQESRFLMGQTNGSGDKPPFALSLDWLVKPTNFQKVIEGRYHRD